MRMWMVNPEYLCRKHLLGEHVECHMFAGTIRRGVSLAGYLRKGLFEPGELRLRHDILAVEMRKRGYSHKSPLIEFDKHLARYSIDLAHTHVSTTLNLIELQRRCPDCRDRILLKRNKVCLQ